MFIINRVRKFTAGNLKGIEFEDCVFADTLEEAKEKAKLYKCDNPVGGSPYEVISSKITIE